MRRKIFKNLEEQIAILKEKGLTVTDIDKTKEILLRENYFFISGYRHIFMRSAKEKVFIPGTTFDELYGFFVFDRVLRNIIFKNVLIIENNFKSIISYQLSKQYGVKERDYLKPTNFTLDIKKGRQVNDVINKMKRQIRANGKQHRATMHYLSNYGYIPLWILVNGLTLGKKSTFYSLLKTNEKNTVSNHFSIPPSILGTFLKLLTGFRNICAHSDRLYNATLLDASISSLLIHDELKISKTKNQEYIYGKNDLFALLIVCYYFLKTEEFSQLCEAIDSEIIHLAANTRLAYEEIRKVMNFPVDWKKIKEINVLCKSRLPK